MTLTDDQLLDFDASRLADYEAGDGERALEEHGDVYRTQLVTARFLTGWAARVGEAPSMVTPKMDEGIQWALREVAAHLRQGDLLPGGVLYEEEQGR